MSLINIEPREYQKRIFEVTKKNNTLVILPTGLGKTLIALLLSIERKKQIPLSKILFLAPTKPLVDQHFQYFQKHLSELFADLQMFTGSVNAEKRKEIWQTAEIIFSTPQCIANDLEKNLYSLEDVSLLIIDEAHRCLKNYDYTTVVKYYKEKSKDQRILGLTASPGSDPDQVREICTHLEIDEIEIRTRDSEDVKNYLQERDFQKVEVNFPSEFVEIKVLLRRIWDSKIDWLKSKNILQGPANKITILKLQNRLASQASSGNYAAMYAMSQTAQAIKISHAEELLETQTLSGLNAYLDNLQSQANEKKSKAVQNLVGSPEFRLSRDLISNLLKKQIEHPKIEKTKELIEQELKEKTNAKTIIFTQFRETALRIKSKLLSINGAKPAIFVGQTKKGETGLSQKEQKEIVEKFKVGEINILIATSIGEEGLDIPEVNAVIFYEPVASAIRKIQRAGRTARLAPGKLIILVTKDTRDESHHYASSAREKKMHNIIEKVKKELKEKKKSPNLNKFF